MPRKRKDEATVGPRKRLNLDGTNHRNGSSRKRIAIDDDPLDVEIPSDREGTFDPVLIAKSDQHRVRCRCSPACWCSTH